jgi:hypothetical protein
MKIRTQFKITLILFSIVLVTISASVIITNQLVEKAGTQRKIADSIARGANELSYLANDFVIYQEDQQLSRWNSRYASFSEDIDNLDSGNPEQQMLTNNLKMN